MDDFTQVVYVVGRLVPNGVEMLGTGFLATQNGFVVTTRHVLGGSHDNLVILAPATRRLNDYQDLSDLRCTHVSAEVAEIDPVKDLAILRTEVKFSGVMPKIGGFDTIKVGDHLGIFGFPHCVDGRRVLTYQSASLGAKVLTECEGISVKHGVLNIQSRPGQSGSLIFDMKSGMISGVLIGAWIPPMAKSSISLGGINPRELHQTTHCVSAEYIKDML